MKKNMTFEESISKLEGIVKMLEDGNLSLDESLSSFEEAIGLVKVCNEKLESAQRRVKVVVESADGIVNEKPFDLESDEA